MFQEAVSKEEAPRRDTGLPQNAIVRRAYAGVAGDRAELLTIQRHQRNLVPGPGSRCGPAILLAIRRHYNLSGLVSSLR
jgi:hypothetical protein